MKLIKTIILVITTMVLLQSTGYGESRQEVSEQPTEYVLKVAPLSLLVGSMNLEVGKIVTDYSLVSLKLNYNSQNTIVGSRRGISLKYQFSPDGIRNDGIYWKANLSHKHGSPQIFHYTDENERLKYNYLGGMVGYQWFFTEKTFVNLGAGAQISDRRVVFSKINPAAELRIGYML